MIKYTIRWHRDGFQIMRTFSIHLVGSSKHVKGKDLRKEGMLQISIYEEWMSMKGHCPFFFQDLLKLTETCLLF